MDVTSNFHTALICASSWAGGASDGRQFSVTSLLPLLRHAALRLLASLPDPCGRSLSLLPLMYMYGGIYTATAGGAIVVSTLLCSAASRCEPNISMTEVSLVERNRTCVPILPFTNLSIGPELGFTFDRDIYFISLHFSMFFYSILFET